GFKLVDDRDQRPEPFDFALVLRTNNFLQYPTDHRSFASLRMTACGCQLPGFITGMPSLHIEQLAGSNVSMRNLTKLSNRTPKFSFPSDRSTSASAAATSPPFVLTISIVSCTRPPLVGDAVRVAAFDLINP